MRGERRMSKVILGLTVIYIVRLLVMDWSFDVARTFVAGIVGGIILAYWFIIFISTRK